MAIAFRDMTNHGARRMQQRAISQTDIERLLRYGRAIHKHQAVRFIFDKAARKRFERDEGRHAIKQAENKLDIFAVFSLSGALVTTGYRTERMWR